MGLIKEALQGFTVPCKILQCLPEIPFDVSKKTVKLQLTKTKIKLKAGTFGFISIEIPWEQIIKIERPSSEDLTKKQNTLTFTRLVDGEEFKTVIEIPKKMWFNGATVWIQKETEFTVQ